ncbi:hypothetical protein [Chondromyces crocatus]|uniref:Pyrrolidone-carboxylate peptidase n=1 Tax=Chondromyces crocatus TaxID=52 RepID=A0A0K1EEJ0_CHOCO|nr:hypothetical protein [Chondromyces crocatus]AKT39290.1 uncharacterized protein CMC5_034380 [Chondromyces crocatus]
MITRILVTGFEPFDGALRNPSGDAARALEGRELRREDGEAGWSAQITSRVLPVVWEVAGSALLEAVREVGPAIVLCLGMAQGTFRVERFADDVCRDRLDNAGKRPAQVREQASVRLASRLPVERIEQALNALGVPVEPSEDAGGFLCNQVFFALLSACAAGEVPSVERAGFLHVPSDAFVPSQITQAHVEAAVVAALGVTLEELAEAACSTARASRG